MAIKSKKSILLEIMNQILHEYKSVNHHADITTCGLCREFMNRENYDESCINCPMHVFEDYDNTYPCMARKSEPVDCRFLDPKDKDLKRVIKFYEKVIAKIESMSTQAVARSSFKFLIKIDDEVYNELNK